QVAPEPAIAGTEVVTASDQPLGSVVETVFDAQGQPAFVVISAGKDMTVLPYQTARAMMNGQKIVIDRTRLTKAPKVKPGEWKDEAGASEWKNQATQYWDRG
ncbi:MAG: PRC-barrel domain-containing protein, partial [Povalibacter sp.]